MLAKFMIPGLATVFAVALSSLWPQEEPGKDAKVVEKTVEVKSVDSGEALRDVHGRLRRIRAERLADRPRALSDDAAKLYRQAVKAFEAKEFDKAKALTQAANELTRALELSLANRRDESPDPDLPPPPGARTAVKVFTFTNENADKLIGMPPPLPTDEKTPPASSMKRKVETRIGGKLALPRTGEEQTVIIDGDRIRLVRPSGVEDDRQLIVEKLDTDDKQIEVRVRSAVDAARTQAESARAEATKARDAVQNAHRKVIEGLHLDIQKLTQKDGEKVDIELPAKALAEVKRAEATAKLHESLAGKVDYKITQLPAMRLRLAEKVKAGGVDKNAAIAELKRAYETILSARKHDKGDHSRTYLDAARDLYNSARREAESGHFERATELAKAAEALTLVPKHLDALKSGAGIPGHNPHSPVQVRVFRHETKDGKGEIRVEESKTTTKKETTTETLPKIDQLGVQGDVKVFRLDTKEGHPQIHVEGARPADGKKEGKEEKQRVEVKIVEKGKPEDGADDASLQGIGVTIEFENGRANITGLIPSGPAAKDGRIKAGDSIMGIETENGGIVGFADKPLEVAVKLLRGPAGSKVKVLIQPSGSKDRKVYEIERQKMEFPKTPEAKPASPPGAKGAELPPMLD